MGDKKEVLRHYQLALEDAQAKLNEAKIRLTTMTSAIRSVYAKIGDMLQSLAMDLKWNQADEVIEHDKTCVDLKRKLENCEKAIDDLAKQAKKAGLNVKRNHWGYFFSVDEEEETK